MGTDYNGSEGSALTTSLLSVPLGGLVDKIFMDLVSPCYNSPLYRGGERSSQMLRNMPRSHKVSQAEALELGFKSQTM